MWKEEGKRNESIEMKIISKIDTELRVQPEEGVGWRENNPEYWKNWYRKLQVLYLGFLWNQSNQVIHEERPANKPVIFKKGKIRIPLVGPQECILFRM